MSPHLAIGSTGPAPPPNLILLPRSIAARTKSFDLATASGNGAPRTICAAIALDNTQPVPCRFRESMRGAAKRRTPSRRHQEIDRVAVEMAALHQHGARAERQQRAPLRGHVGFVCAAARPSQRAASARLGVSRSTRRSSRDARRLDEAGAGERVAGRGDHHGS